MKKHIADLIFVLVIFCFCSIGLIRAVLSPNRISYVENRPADQFSTPTFSSFADQNFQNHLEQVFADQIPFAEFLKGQNHDWKVRGLDLVTKQYRTQHENCYVTLPPVSSKISAENIPGTPHQMDKPIPVPQWALIGERNIVHLPRNLKNLIDDLSKTAETCNQLFRAFPEIAFYFYYVENDTDFRFDTGKSVGTQEYFLSQLNLPPSCRGGFHISSYQNFCDNFYATDHHWNQRGSYRAYLDLHTLLDCKEAALTPVSQEIISEHFVGSKAREIGSRCFDEVFSAYRFNFPPIDILVDGNPVADYGQQNHYDAEQNSTLSYSAFYGGDAGEVVFDTGRSEQESILIIGDSYDNAILKLLSSHFYRTYAVDLRHYERTTGQKFDFSSYLAEHKIEKVLFIGSTTYFISDAFDWEI